MRLSSAAQLASFASSQARTTASKTVVQGPADGLLRGRGRCPRSVAAGVGAAGASAPRGRTGLPLGGLVHDLRRTASYMDLSENAGLPAFVGVASDLCVCMKLTTTVAS
jgi:hypothetical protein